MASQAESNRAVARLEMERLHKGMVVELERRFAPVPTDISEGEMIMPEIDEDPEVAEAISLLQNTVESIRDLKVEIEEREQAIRSRDGSIQQLENDKAQLLQERTSLESQLESARHRLNEASATISRQDAQIRQIVEAIRTSFAPASAAELPEQMRAERG